MKRARVIPVVVLFLSLILAPARAAVDEPLRLEVTEHTDVHHEFTGTAKSYGVTITNLTSHTVTIERGILIEKKTASGWVRDAGIQAVATCGDLDIEYHWRAPIRLKAHSTLAVFPWDGYQCGGQCISGCLKNGRVGPGVYRFVAVIVPGGKKIASPPFTMLQPRF